ncbi:TetR family transcriptional regulator C-terminal domain-containing protein [Aurantimonas sp. C2-6-R+9]|nr:MULTISPECIES: TetR family transcriptional regulator C-terminal domain-containing protein [unclassified Aurantimonas]MEC5291057.1 TetR family transcriptional regulator C-terminal domain-containing protein [Aurantimonas sp. C2-3-R2]MEC5323488.1 TetR family transcriptional regulator C-terminal domain-containing protein [Aurantimonas sp. A3-2-R12]MEC5381386.1 TetR family transcriptional regulator C-terminal domain-containing protein [Aurantimonas sp. C2-6-R+9]MEC5412208.1 TetR family transcripti
MQAINREVILEAALEVFSVHGFRGSTVDQIASRAAMSKPNLLYYFRRKQDIYHAVLERTLRDWLVPLAAIDAGGDPVEELRRYITEKLRMVAERPAASRLFANEILAGAPVMGGFLETTLKELVDEKADIIREWVGRGQLAPVDPHHLIFMIWATTQHYADFDVQIRAVMGDLVDRPGFREEAAQAVLTLVLNGLKPRS